MKVLFLFAFVVSAVAQTDTTPPRPSLISSHREQFRVLYEWRTIDFEWESPGDREAYLNTSRYIPQNVLISGINFYGENIFLTLPRMLDGVPATLTMIPAFQNETTAPKLKPFPSWSDNAIGNCDALQFVQNVEVDRNGIMWILDNGRVGTLTQKPNTKCPPSIVLIDLKSGNNKIERFPFPATTVNPNATYLNDLVVDNRGDSDYAYITDNSAVDPGIIVFRLSDKKSWKLRDTKSMSSVPEAAIFRINGTTVNLPVNIDGIALGPQFFGDDGQVDRKVYYSPLSSLHLYAINASVLRNESLADQDGALRPYVVDLGTKASQTDGMKMDSTGILFYGLISNSTIAEWNSTTDFQTNQRTIARDTNYIQWVDRFTFDNRGNIYVVINRLYNFVRNQVSIEEVNYRILKSYNGLKSYVFAEDLKPDTPQNGASALSTVTASVLALVLAHLFA